MRAYEATATIEASADTIWTVLTDGPGFTQWDSGIVRVDGQIAPDEKITVVSKVNPGRTFPVKVTEFAPGKKMVWSGGMPLGLFKGVRTFDLAPEAGGTTRFSMREEYSGLLAGLIFRSIPDLGPSFEQFATGLKTRAETV